MSAPFPVAAPSPAPNQVLHNVPVGAVLRVRARADGDLFHPPWRPRVRAAGAAPLPLLEAPRGPLHAAAMFSNPLSG